MTVRSAVTERDDAPGRSLMLRSKRSSSASVFAKYSAKFTRCARSTGRTEAMNYRASEILIQKSSRFLFVRATNRWIKFPRKFVSTYSRKRARPDRPGFGQNTCAALSIADRITTAS